MPAGRWGLIYYRPLGMKRLGLSQMPYESFPNTRIGIGGTVMYKGSKNKELAAYFFKFLASDRFNELMVEGADALPPVPAFAYGEAFTHPPDYPQEWGLHEPFREQALTTGIPIGMSPFILARVLFRIELDAYERFMNGRLSAEDAARRASERIDRAIERALNDGHFREKCRKAQSPYGDGIACERIANVLEETATDASFFRKRLTI